MAPYKPMAATRESPISDQRDILAQSLAHNGGGWGEHFAHPGSSFWAFIADDDDIAFANSASQDFFHCLFLGIKHARFADKAQTFLPSNFGDRTFGCEVAVKNHEMALLLERLLERCDDRLFLGIRFHICQCLRHGLAGNRQTIAMKKASLEQRPHQRSDAADGDEFGHEMFAREAKPDPIVPLLARGPATGDLRHRADP